MLPASKRTLVLLLAAFVPVYASVLQLGTRLNLVAAHARYAFSGLPLLAVFLTICWACFWPPRRRAAAVAALPVAVLVWSTWVAASVLGPAYRMPFPADRSENVLARFAPGLVLRGVSWEEDEIRPGATARLHLEMAAMEDLSQRPAADLPGLVIFAQLIGAADRKAGQVDGPPFAGRFPFEAWPAGADFEVPIALPIASDALSGPVDLLVGIYPDGSPESRLAAFDPRGNPLSQNAWRLPASVTIRNGADQGDGDPAAPEIRP